MTTTQQTLDGLSAVADLVRASVGKTAYVTWLRDQYFAEASRLPDALPAPEPHPGPTIETTAVRPENVLSFQKAKTGANRDRLRFIPILGPFFRTSTDDEPPSVA